MKPIISVSDVWKIYQMGEVEVPALRGLNIDIYPEQLAVIKGPSGSGKSTAMNVIGCLDLPTKGTIKLEGKDISDLHESELAQLRGRKIGFVFQQFNLLHHLTALRNVTLPAVFQKVPEEERIERAKEILQSVGLGDRIDHTPSELSGGERQRVAIARALMNDPDIILADEPTGDLDSETSKEVMSLLEGLNDEGKTLIIVTHDPNVARCTNCIHHLKDGKIISDEKDSNRK